MSNLQFMKYTIKQDWLILTINKLFENKTIEDFFHDYQLSKKTIHLLKQNKNYFLNNEFVPTSTSLKLNDQLKIKAFDLTGPNFIPNEDPIDVIYEDEFLLIVNKPAHLKVHPDQKEDINTLCNRVANYYLENQIYYPVRYLHRLDEDTTGLVIFCKCQLLQAYLDKQLATKKIRRNYLAFVEGKVKDKEIHTIETYLGRDRHQSNKMRVANKGQLAITHYQLIQRCKNNSLLKCSLETGRTHQIRVHLASIHHPIIGDELYGNSSDLIQRQALHAYEIEMIHPIKQIPLKITIPLPTDIQNLIIKN